MKRIILKGVNPNHFPEITPVSDDQYSLTLTAGEQQTIAVPDDARYVIFNADADIFVAYENEVVIPDSSYSGVLKTNTEFNPGQRYIGDKQDIRVKVLTPTLLHLSFYA